MTDWKNLLQSVNDDYLIGLTNKGIVKRAYKDMDEVNCSMKEEENQIVVSAEDFTCTIISPLAGSKCSCPSRSICKHIVIAILYAKIRLETKVQSETAKVSEEKHREDNAKAEGIGDNDIRIDNIKIDNKRKISTTEDGTGKDDTKEDFPSLINYPFVKLKRALGNKNFQEIFNKTKQGIKPEITINSIVTVYFPDRDITVRLLEPVENSSCTCHKKELCRHKAEAILAYQYEVRKITEQDFESHMEEITPADLENLNEYAIHLKGFLTEQMATGLARSSPAILDSFERLAIVSHNQKLPEFERNLRELKEEYELYFNRAASFEVRLLLRRMSSLYLKAESLLKVGNGRELGNLAGEFRTEYLPCPVLTLLGMGQRYFSSKTGYEGETYYFLSEDTMEWYTYTNARPVYYENDKKRPVSDQANAPWQLPCKLENLSEAKIILKNGKASADHRLSATSEAKAELIGTRRLDNANLKPHYYEDFLRLFEERISDTWQEEAAAKTGHNLVLVRPSHIKNASFHTIRQEFTMELYDKENRMVLLQVKYQKTEHYTIRFLERLARRIEQGDSEIPCFFGMVYTYGGKLILYPINYYSSSEFA